MKVVTDLHIHSKYSRAVSQNMVFPEMWQWARKKGIDVIATGDWTHPLWFREIKAYLEEMGNGLLKLKTDTKGKGPYFMLSTELSSIYSQGGKGRRIHTLFWLPSIKAAEKINQALTKRGMNLLSDGRPILGLSSEDLADLVLNIEPKTIIVPAHCLLPDAMVLTDGFVPQAMKDIQAEDKVLTHTGTFQLVTEVMKRMYEGEIITIQPWYFRPGLTTTPEHPFYAIKPERKCSATGDICRPSRAHMNLCRKKTYQSYKPTWIQSKELQIGDILVYPRSTKKLIQTHTTLIQTEKRMQVIHAGGTRGRSFKNQMPVTLGLGRFIGYYLAEGSTDGNNSFSFCFAGHEKEYIQDVIELGKQLFSLDHPRISYRRNRGSCEITFYSKLHAQWLSQICYATKSRRISSYKNVPDFLLSAEATVQAELLRGWYRGDKGYTSSRVLMNQMKAVCLYLGIIPSIRIDSKEQHTKRGNHQYRQRVIRAQHDSYAFFNFSFFTDEFDLKKEIKRSQTKIDRRHGWIDDDYVYLPIKNIQKKRYKGYVYNLEVKQDSSYVTEFAAVHNCWTPWFSLYGSKSGFDSVDECFGRHAKHIYAVETGLSSNPTMNWQIPDLDNRAIVSFSDAHSCPKLGREATVFELPELSYDMIGRALTKRWRDNTDVPKNGNDPHIVYTIEFYPEEGKYHYTGHRNCNVRQDPSETKKKGATCHVCGRPLTVGVMHRVEDLAGRSEKDLGIEKKKINGIDARFYKSEKSGRPPFTMLVPLLEILAESLGVKNTYSQKVKNEYERLIHQVGDEFSILLKIPLEDIVKVSGTKVAEGIGKVRRGDLVIEPGYDGVFGVVKIWQEGEEKGKQGTTVQVLDEKEQLSLF